MRLLALTVILAAGLAAQSFEVGGGGGVIRFSNRDIGSVGAGPNDRATFDDGWKFGFRMAFNNDKHFGHETGYGYNRTTLKLSGQTFGGMAVHIGFYNFLLYATPEGKRVRPFATGGVHFANSVAPGTSAQNGQGSTKFGFNYGGGVKAKITDKFGLRFDVRQYQHGKPFGLPDQKGLIKLMEVSAGFYLWM